MTPAQMLSEVVTTRSELGESTGNSKGRFLLVGASRKHAVAAVEHDVRAGEVVGFGRGEKHGPHSRAAVRDSPRIASLQLGRGTRPPHDLVRTLSFDLGY
jgi:hypothetical protein